MESHFANLIRPYAGWAAVLLLVVAVYSGLIATKGTFPLLMFIAAGLLAGVRYWHTLKTFDIRAIQEWYRTRRDSIGVREWFSPYHAAALFCSPEIVKARDAAAAEMNSIMMELVRQPDRGPRTFGDFNRPADASRIGSNPTPNHSQYDAAHARFDRCNVALARELLAQLARIGKLRKQLKRSDLGNAEKQKIQRGLKGLHSICVLGINEILFSYWHVLHLPLFVMLVLTGFIHVAVVHLY